MRIGYACLAVGVPGTELRTCVQKYATPEKLEELITHNLDALDRMIDYNIRQGIRLFRISSDIIPFGSSPVNTLDWRELFGDKLQAIGEKALQHGIRLSMHPGQYTVLNSPREDVVKRAVEDLRYHTGFLDSLGLDGRHKIILHIGGVYGDREAAMERFIQSYRRLDENIKRRLIIENDDKMYPVNDVLEIGLREQIPVVFDVLHHQVLGDGSDPVEWIGRCNQTWKPQDGPQKIHYSQQAEGKRPGSHSETVWIDAFLELYGRLPDLDIMLEVKDKNRSAVKCIHSTMPEGHIKLLEGEWARYKYMVLEKAPDVYQEIRRLLKDKSAFPAREFYRCTETAMKREESAGHQLNAAHHIWGYFKDRATAAEKNRFQKLAAALQAGEGTAAAIKRMLWKLAEKYNQPYLLESYYFMGI